MTAKNEAYSGPPVLASDMSAGRKGASSAGRGRGENRLDEAGKQRAPSARQAIRRLRRLSARQPLRSKYQHRRTKWPQRPCHMTRAPPRLHGPYHFVPVGGAMAPELFSGPPIAPALCGRLAEPASGVPPHLDLPGALRGAAASDPAALRPSGPPAGAGRWRATLSYGAGRGGAPPPLRLRGPAGVRFRGLLFFAFAAWIMAAGF